LAILRPANGRSELSEFRSPVTKHRRFGKIEGPYALVLMIDTPVNHPTEASFNIFSGQIFTRKAKTTLLIFPVLAKTGGLLQHHARAPLINAVAPQALRRVCPQGAVVQEGWLPFKRLQRSRQTRRNAPQGGPLAPIG
jgi:hypothetical protein